MEDRPSRVELIKILMQDRNHHFSHPHEVAVKFYYSLGGTITTLLISFFIKNNEIPDLKNFISEEARNFGFYGIMIIIGYMMIFWGLNEHTALHTNQRKRIEAAIAYLIAVKPEEFKFDIFWEKYGVVKLKYNGRNTSKTVTNLLVAEPDTRSWLRYHDRKIELGIGIILIGVLGLLMTLFN